MAEPENLQIIKAEGQQLPETEAQPRRLIKERLNLHVKRRLQQEQQEPQAQIITHPSVNTTRESVAVAAPQQSPQSTNVNANSIANDVNSPSTSTSKSKKRKEPVKTRRPYQKRADKSATKIQHQQAQAGGVVCLSPSVEESSVGRVVGGDMGGDEADVRDTYSRDKEKCPDILGMVLSGKKRALMQNAEVQEFLGKIMAAFKN